MAGAALALGAAAWLTAGAALAGPVALAEASARDGDEYMRLASGFDRKARAGDVRRDTRDAITGSNLAAAAGAGFEAALRRVPYNADYAFRAAGAWRFAGEPDRARGLLAKAIALDPSEANYYLNGAEAELRLRGQNAGAQPSRDSLIIEDFRKALSLDPNNVAARLDYAAALERYGRRGEAADQYSRALWYDAQLSREENKRLPDERVREIQKHRDALAGAAPK
jgi:tetratricopeptide (TPR) repeat protein